MLPKDRQTQKEKKGQQQLDGHLQPIVKEVKAPPYTDDRFRAAAIQWLVNTDQVRATTPSAVSIWLIILNSRWPLLSTPTSRTCLILLPERRVA